MKASAVACVRHLVTEYRSFLRTSYRFLDPHLRSQFEEHLKRAEVVVKGPFVSLSRDFQVGPTLTELVARGEAEAELQRAHWAFGKHPVFAHQARALAAGRAGRPFVVTTGTGSGKTESFLLPVLDGIVRRKREGVRGVQAILLYPMNALANDQLERLRRLLRGSGLDVSFALWTGDSDAVSSALREEPAETERTRKDQVRQDPPDILLTNYKQLEFLLVRKRDRVLFHRSLRYLVLDELHSYRGALATEIACLIRRLKAHAGLKAGELVGIGTSATVGSGDAAAALANFSTVLFGEEFRQEDVFREEHVTVADMAPPWVPPSPALTERDLDELVETDEDAVIRLAERLTGRKCRGTGSIADRIGSVLAGNRIAQALENFFTRPGSLEQALAAVKAELKERRETPDEALQLEIETYLALGSIGDESSPPRFRPKLHTFFHGVYDVWLCSNPMCRTLVPQGGGTCTQCGSKALPAALCRTCGQDFLKVTFSGDDDTLPIGTGDFYSNEATGFLTHEIHELPASKDEEEEEAPEDPPKKGRSRQSREDRLEKIRFCTKCGRITTSEAHVCPNCEQKTTTYLLHRGSLNACPACGDIYTRGDIVTPLRTGTASTVSTLTTHHLDLLEGQDRKVLVFADNRQDVAHQAGYTTDKHRVFALRHLVSKLVRDAGPDGRHLSELPNLLLDEYKKLKIIPGKPTKPEVQNWLAALQYECANEFTRYTRQRASLENLGLIAVSYEFLDELSDQPAFKAAHVAAGISAEQGLVLARILLDVMRKNRAVAFDFFQEFLDPEKRRYRLLEGCGIRFPDRDRAPKGFALDRPDHIRKARAGSVLGFFQENTKAGQLTAIHKVFARVLGDRNLAAEFIRRLVPILEELTILVPVSAFPIPVKERVASLRILQINPKVIHLEGRPSGFRCNACQAWCAFDSPTCPTPRCRTGSLTPAISDRDNYYVRLYGDREPRRLIVSEHSAQVSGEDRARRETDFKEGRLDALVCSPTLELGVDIGPLLTVVLRNAPPTPANYIQRVGRAGRRLRIGFVSTFCAGGAHDRHAFEDPLWLISGRFTPPRLRLDNPRVVHRHLHSYLLEHLEAELPALMKELLDDVKTPTRWMPEGIAALRQEIEGRKDELVGKLTHLFDLDRSRGRTARYTPEECRELVENFDKDLTGVLESWWARVRQLDKEHQEYSTIGSPRQDERKASARKRAYYEITQDHERAYTLNYLSTQGLLPAYQFPIDTFSLDPGVQDTSTLYRAAAIALEEFAPGNYVYANGHKLRSIRVLFAGGPGKTSAVEARSDAETSGRLHSFQFCENCDEAVEASRNSCDRCGSPLGEAKDCIFVEAFEAEESLRIGSDEESRQRIFFGRREHLIAKHAAECRLHAYPLAPVEHRRLASMLVTNWGPTEKRGLPKGFWLCPDCGRHRSGDPGRETDDSRGKTWDSNHARYCSGVPQNVILGYRCLSDCLVLSVQSPEDEAERSGRRMSPTLATLAEALTIGASDVLELEPGEIASFPRRSPEGSVASEIVFYETVPGGAGYVEEMARRLPDVARAAAERLYGHDCQTACYLCLKRYHNQFWHPFLDKGLVRDLLRNLASMEPTEGTPAEAGSAARSLEQQLPGARREVENSRRIPGTPGPQSPIESLLLDALRRQPGCPEPEAQYEIHRDGRLFTVPDFAFPTVKIAIFCDGYAYHGNKDTLALDAKKRNWMQSQGWIVLTYWGRAITRDADACALEIRAVVEARSRASAPKA